MDVTTGYPADRELNSGERIRIRRGRRPLRSDLAGQTGMIVEVFRAPQGSCLVRIDGDPNHQREWFLYRMVGWRPDRDARVAYIDGFV